MRTTDGQTNRWTHGLDESNIERAVHHYKNTPYKRPGKVAPQFGIRVLSKCGFVAILCPASWALLFILIVN